MTIGRIAGAIAVAILVLLPVCALARTPAAAQQVVPAARITELAQRIARAQVSDPDRALVPAFSIADQNVPAGSVAIVAGSPLVNSSYVGVPIRIEVDGRPARTLYAGFRIAAYVRTPVAAHDLTSGEILTADDLAYARLPFTGHAGLEIETLVGRKMAAGIVRGDPVALESTSVNELVRAGMPAVLIVRDGSVALSADVVARSSGGLGEYVTIFDPLTLRTLSGVVTGPNTVELTLPGAN